MNPVVHLSVLALSLCLTCVTASTRNLADVKFEAHGQLDVTWYFWDGKVRATEPFRFSIFVDGDNWRMTASTEIQDARGTPLHRFLEAGTDGVDTFQSVIDSYDRETKRVLGGHRASIRHGRLPFIQGELHVVWMALATAGFIDSHTHLTKLVYPAPWDTYGSETHFYSIVSSLDPSVA